MSELKGLPSTSLGLGVYNIFRAVFLPLFVIPPPSGAVHGGPPALTDMQSLALLFGDNIIRRAGAVVGVKALNGAK